MLNKTCKVIKAHKASFSYSVLFALGDKVKIEDKKTDSVGWKWCVSKEGAAAWIPENYLDLDGFSAIFKCDYDSTELAVEEGNVLACEKIESGWAWCSRPDESGWVPVECLDI